MSQGSALSGFDRILTTEVHVSNLLQELTYRDPTPWGDLIGMVPIAADRERSFTKLSGAKHVPGSIDLLLKSPEDDEVAIEVKIAHHFSEDQRKRYEASSDGTLLLLGMAADRELVNSHPRWAFRSLADVFEAWSQSSDEGARLLARMTAQTMRKWDDTVGSVFRPATGPTKLDSLQEKFLAKLVSRQLKHDINEDGWLSLAGVSSGSSGLALVQGFAALNGDEGRCLIAEARWIEGLQQINFRLGIDFSDLPETRDARSEAWDLAKKMTDAIRIDAFQGHLKKVRQDLGEFVTYRGGGGRSNPDDKIWLPVVERGLRGPSNLAGVPGPEGKRGTRQNLSPGFVGDGTLRFEASGQIETNLVDAVDVRDLIGEALKYLCSALPEGYSTPDPARIGS